MGLEMMSIPVHMMAAGSWFGTMHEVNLTPTPAGKKVSMSQPHQLLLLEKCTWNVRLHIFLVELSYLTKTAQQFRM